MDRVVGILAHVDAGKTTFSEQILVHAGVLRAPGRVDHGDAFLDALDRGEFVNLWDPERTPSLFDTPHQTHLCLCLEDGSSVQLRLFAEGYVWYTGLGHHFVKMPGPEFDAVYAACGGK